MDQHWCGRRPRFSSSWTKGKRRHRQWADIDRGRYAVYPVVLLGSMPLGSFTPGALAERSVEDLDRMLELAETSFVEHKSDIGLVRHGA